MIETGPSCRAWGVFKAGSSQGTKKLLQNGDSTRQPRVSLAERKQIRKALI
jgi:hypothetical protein